MYQQQPYTQVSKASDNSRVVLFICIAVAIVMLVSLIVIGAAVAFVIASSNQESSTQASAESTTSAEVGRPQFEPQRQQATDDRSRPSFRNGGQTGTQGGTQCGTQVGSPSGSASGSGYVFEREMRLYQQVKNNPQARSEPAFSTLLTRIYTRLSDGNHHGPYGDQIPMTPQYADYFIHGGVIVSTGDYSPNGLERWELTCFAFPGEQFASQVSISRFSGYDESIANELSAATLPKMEELQVEFKACHQEAFSLIADYVANRTDDSTYQVEAESDYREVSVEGLAGTFFVHVIARTNTEFEYSDTGCITSATYRWYYVPPGQSFVKPAY